MKSQFKTICYRVCKYLGLFSIAHAITANGLRIICYHGFATSDESHFRPMLFMEPETFRKRMLYLREHGYTVLPLENAVELLAAGQLPRRAVVITIDDGFFSVFRHARPILLEYSMPTTVYVTSYYAARQNPIFRLVIQYIFWRAGDRNIELSGLELPLSCSALAGRPEETERLMWEIIRYGELECDEPKRCEVMRELASRASIDFTCLEKQRGLSLMNADEIQQLSADGIDIQLHTHRHTLPGDDAIVRREIAQNREFLEPLTRKELRHLCYPSGIWSRSQWRSLQELDINTATTCDPGLNYRNTPSLGLRRFLDGENISDIEFEAELCGFSELLRRGKSALHLKARRQYLEQEPFVA